MAGPEEGKNNAVSETHGAYYKRMTDAMKHADTVRELRSAEQTTQDLTQVSAGTSETPSATGEALSVLPTNPQQDKE